MVTEWLEQFNTALTHSPTDPAGLASATLVIAVLRGLLLDWLSTGDQTRTNDAMEQFAPHPSTLMSQRHTRPRRRSTPGLEWILTCE